MKIVLFYHSVISDWNHGNAHFLRGVASELLRSGHEVRLYESADAWSLRNLVADHGTGPIADFHAAYPLLHSIRYDRMDAISLKAALHGADLVIVHEWNDPELVRGVALARPRGCVALFHDTHHRTVTAPEAISAANLEHYDGVLTYGKSLERLYRERGLARRAWTWHEAADTSVFQPMSPDRVEGDLVWIGNWGDGERAAEIEEFLIRPVEALGLSASVFGVRYPDAALQRLARAGIRYRGWLPNFKVPEVFARFRVTVHIPRGPYVRMLPGIPTIRPFEALACGIPLLSSPWEDTEGLFAPGRDFRVARDGCEMTAHLQSALRDAAQAREMARHGLRTIHHRHTCAHRVEELLAIYRAAKESL